MRKSGIYIIFTAAATALFALLFIGHPRLTAPYHRHVLKENLQLVQKLGLTDLCLFTETPYTRHLSQADNFSAFKDSPRIFEHFPSGSMTTPTQLVRSEINRNP